MLRLAFLASSLTPTTLTLTISSLASSTSTITTLLMVTSMLPVAEPIVKHKSTLCTRGEAKSICVPQVNLLELTYHPILEINHRIFQTRPRCIHEFVSIRFRCDILVQCPLHIHTSPF